MTDGSVGRWNFVWQLSVFGMPLTVLMGMLGLMAHSSHLNRVSDCTAAFGPEAIPIEYVQGGTLCHVGESVSIAPGTESVPQMEVLQSFINAGPLWAYAAVALIATVFFTGVVIKATRRFDFGGTNAQ